MTESDQSKNLMKLNAYYNDTRYGNKKLMWLVEKREKVDETRALLRNIANVGKQGIKKTAFQVKCYLNPKLINDKKIKYQFDHSDELNYKVKGDYREHEIAVYTSIFGNYDHLIEPLYESKYCDYFAITDQEVSNSSVWKKLDCSGIDGFDKLDDYHKAKFCKMFPHILFPKYKYSIWVDGNVQIVADMMPLIDRMNNAAMATFENPRHNCIYTEARYNICQNNARVGELENQIQIYKQDGFPVQFGMREFSIIARKNQDVEMQHLMKLWWEQVSKYTMRDQISFPYVLWKNGHSIDYIKSLGLNWRWNPRFILYPHDWHITFDK